MRNKILLALLLLVTALHGVAKGDKQFTLVIDAGHGGKDHGAPGSFSKEKDLTLKYALAFGKVVEQNSPDVRVIYTRKTDVFIPLIERAEIANRNKADLFISIHINAIVGNRSARGFQSYTLGRGSSTGDKGIRENLDVAKRENGVIYLEKDYKTVYKGFDPNSAESDIMFEFIADKNRERSVELSRLMQKEVCKATGRQNSGSHQNNLAVLRLTSMPATLLELGFISTPDEEVFLNSDDALSKYTQGMYNAFLAYKNKYDKKTRIPFRPQNESKTLELQQVLPGNVSVGSEVKETTGDSVTIKIDSTNTVKSDKPVGVQAQAVKQPKPVEPVTPKKQEEDNEKPVFKIQLFVSSYLLKDGDSHFKGLQGCEYYQEGAYKKYTYGSSTNYNEIYRLRKEILDKFPDCFIIALKNGERTDVHQAIRAFKSNR